MKYSYLTIGQKVKQLSGTQVMKVVGFNPDYIENVIVRWRDEVGNVKTAKFRQDDLEIVEQPKRKRPNT